MRLPAFFIVFALACAAATAHAQTSPFDGTWQVTLRCPPHNAADDEAKGYTHRFAADVLQGRMRGTYGKEGEPGWHQLHGKIADDGSAALRLDGIVNNSAHAINNAPRGQEYSYRVKAQFDGNSGTGQRVTGRVCEFRFSR
jgi:hypothetical protein